MKRAIVFGKRYLKFILEGFEREKNKVKTLK